MSKYITDTINLNITLTSILRELLNNQKIIEYESQFNCTQLKFAEYEARILPQTIITKQLINLLFTQYPIFEKNKTKLTISTFRTTKITDSGLNGETGFHRDNVLFPDDCDRNLIITWCSDSVSCSTEALSIQDTETYLAIREKFAYERYNMDIENKYHEIKLSMEDLLYFNDDILNIPKYVTDRKLKLHKSSSPNDQGNISALIMSGKSVLHRREPDTPESIGKYRYVLNIYYKSSDIQL